MALPTEASTVDEDLDWFWEGLLELHQTQLVLSFFESARYGQVLRERSVLIYYAALLLAGRTEDNLLLRIPPEVMPTVEELVQKVREKQAFYAKGAQTTFVQI